MIPFITLAICVPLAGYLGARFLLWLDDAITSHDNSTSGKELDA
jgi:hypothetical protein